jgi:hypothetical protein
MEDGHHDEPIDAALRRLTEDTRRARLELQALVHKSKPERGRAHDRVPSTGRSPKPPVR